mmetsp:Transcript_47944/g.111872  ORF Transcript_47944/g.111872 Transcript_47944/m.111872 type:complete len:267 (-) Transcript_47944:31-831(-)
MGNITNVGECRCFCNGEARPTASNPMEDAKQPQRKEQLWEDLPSSKLLNQMDATLGQIESLTLEFFMTGRGKLHADFQVLPMPEPALVVKSVNPDSDLAKGADGRPGLCAGDRISEVQQQAGTPAELHIMMHSLVETSGMATVSLRLRPTRFGVNLVRAGRYWQRLGIIVAIDRPQNLMVVLSVQEAGLVAEWNEGNNDRCICVGDRIISANGIQSDVVTMYTAIQVTSLGGEIELQVQAPSRSGAASLQAWVQKSLTSGEIVEAL